MIDLIWGLLQTVSCLLEEEEERSSIIDLKRHTQLTAAWSRHGSPVPRGEEEERFIDKTCL